jgi:hypothetical protein
VLRSQALNLTEQLAVTSIELENAVEPLDTTFAIVRRAHKLRIVSEDL